ncbi:hypothetical protein ACVBEH_18090 [Roseateles sp. GG27B]
MALSRQRVLTRRAATIETLGSATVLCSDKTGTLTANQMAVVELARLRSAPMSSPQPQPQLQIWSPNGQPVPADFAELLEFAVLASERQPFDPMERALTALGQAHLPANTLHPDWTLVHEYGLTPQLPAMTHVWQRSGADLLADGPYCVAIKGASEAVAALCGLPDAALLVLAEHTLAMAKPACGCWRWRGPTGWGPSGRTSRPALTSLFWVCWPLPTRCVPRCRAPLRSAGPPTGADDHR